MPYSPYICNRTISHGYIAFKIFGGYNSVINECSLGVYLVIDNFHRAIGPLLLEILHFEDVGYIEYRLAANVVALVLGEYQISIATYLGGYLP